LQGRIEAEDVYYRDIADRWGEALRDALDGLPDFDLPPA
jgi:putative proteasome-type protease